MRRAGTKSPALALIPVVLIAMPVSACGASLTATPAPSSSHTASGSPVLGLDWGRAPSVERPTNFEATLPPGRVPEHPILRIPGQAIMADVAAVPDGSLVAVGYVPPAWSAAAWTSGDGSSWSFHPIDSAEFRFAVAVTGSADGTVVAVGRSRAQPVAWTSENGRTWDRHSAPNLEEGSVERMTTVVRTDDGYLAGGSAGPELLDRHARFWTSADGKSWAAVPDDPSAFENAEVRAIARLSTGFVAVGVVGAAQKPTAAVAWVSADGTRWTRVDDAAFAGTVAVAIVAAPFGGLVAVGSDLDRHEAVAWTSVDGRRWTRVPREASRSRDPGFVWMTDVAAIDDVVVAIGDQQPLQRSTATSWVSRDGVNWEHARDAPVQEQGEFYAITPGGPGAVVVGAFGGPDSYVSTVWLTPAR
jgi:hypothetical protein